MSVSIQLVGLDKVYKSLASFEAKKKAVMLRVLKLAAYRVQAEARRSIMRDVHTGIRYGNHIASAAGQTPASDTGNLVRSIQVLLDEKDQAAYVIARAPYAKWLEYGTLDGKIKARPFLHPALERNREAINKMIKDGLRLTGGGE